MVRLANIYKTAVHRNTPILTRNRVLVEFEWKTTALSGKAGRLILVALSSAEVRAEVEDRKKVARPIHYLILGEREREIEKEASF